MLELYLILLNILFTQYNIFFPPKTFPITNSQTNFTRNVINELLHTVKIKYKFSIK